MVPIFSNVRVNGKPLSSTLNNEEKNMITIQIRTYWKKLRKFKSRSQFGIAKNTYDVLETIIQKKILFVPASVVLQGEYGTNNVAMGVPVKINQHGICEIVEIDLDKFETALLMNSSQKIQNQINSL